jgi:hypothetical protein
LRTILAARSASLRIVVEPAPRALVGRPLREPLGPGQDRGERVVQLVRDAGNRLAERRELLGLEQLVVEIARLVLETLALAHVAHERLDAGFAAGRLGVRRDLDPRQRLIGAPEPQQVVGDRPVAFRRRSRNPRGPGDRRTVRARRGAPRRPASRPRSRTSA